MVVSLYGSDSYLTDAELERLPLLLNPGGRAVTKFYASSYTPELYSKTKNQPVPHRTWRPGITPGVVITDLMPNFVVVITRAET